jgi:hypothetical protein
MRKLKHAAAAVMLAATMTVSGCALFESTVVDVREEFRGLEATIQTFDARGEVIDNVKGNSIAIETDNRFDVRGADGSVTKESSVLNIQVGGKQMYHVGSALVMQEDGITNVLDDTDARAEVDNADSAAPFLTRLKNKYQNDFTGKSMTVLVRSQHGVPLGVYTGNSVSTFAADGIPNSTALLIDGKRLFLYRVEFSIYDTSLLGDPGTLDKQAVSDSPAAAIADEGN